VEKKRSPRTYYLVCTNTLHARGACVLVHAPLIIIITSVFHPPKLAWTRLLVTTALLVPYLCVSRPRHEVNDARLCHCVMR
jgi:hypothetical protein